MKNKNFIKQIIFSIILLTVFINTVTGQTYEQQQKLQEYFDNNNKVWGFSKQVLDEVFSEHKKFFGNYADALLAIDLANKLANAQDKALLETIVIEVSKKGMEKIFPTLASALGWASWAKTGMELLDQFVVNPARMGSSLDDYYNKRDVDWPPGDAIVMVYDWGNVLWNLKKDFRKQYGDSAFEEISPSTLKLLPRWDDKFNKFVEAWFEGEYVKYKVKKEVEKVLKSRNKELGKGEVKLLKWLKKKQEELDKEKDCDKNEYWDEDEEDCECNEGYTENNENECIKIKDCDEDEHWDADEGDCECISGYTEDKHGDCIEREDCDENEHWDTEEGECECNEGYKENEDGICVEDKEIDVKISLTYPAGQSPKVFTSGWVFGAYATVKIGDEPENDISSQVSWSGSGSFAPSQGSISRPTFSGEGRNKIILSVTIDGQTFEEKFKVRAVDPFKGGYAAIGSIALCPADGHGAIGDPLPVQGPIITGSPNVTVGGSPAARVGDTGVHTACSGPNTFKVAEGDPSVLINGKPAARIGDKTAHCGGIGKIVSGMQDLSCGENEKWTEDGCECIDGYEKNNDDICIKVKECDKNEHFDIEKEDCICDDGYTEDEDGVCVSDEEDEEDEEEVMDECSLEYIEALTFMLDVFVADTKLYETKLLGYINKFNKEINDQSSDPCNNSIIAYCYYTASEIAALMAENVTDIHDITIEIIMLQAMCPDLNQQMQGEGITIKSLISSIAGLGSYKEKLAQMESRLRENGCDEDEVKEDGEKIVPPEGDPGFIQDGGISTEMPGDGVDNDGDGQQDEEIQGLTGYNVTLVLYDSGSAADDVFNLYVEGYGNLGQTPAGGLRSYGLNLLPGTYNAVVTVVIAPDDVGTYTLTVLYNGESIGSITGSPPQGSSATLSFTVPSE